MLFAKWQPFCWALKTLRRHRHSQIWLHGNHKQNCQIIMDISGSPIKSQWDSQKYPGWLDSYAQTAISIPKSEKDANFDPNSVPVLGWVLLNQFPLFHYFPDFSTQSKDWLPIEYRVHNWQVLSQLSYYDICQIWERSKMLTGICRIENFLNREINGRSFSNPPPGP